MHILEIFYNLNVKMQLWHIWKTWNSSEQESLIKVLQLCTLPVSKCKKIVKNILTFTVNVLFKPRQFKFSLSVFPNICGETHLVFSKNLLLCYHVNLRARDRRLINTEIWSVLTLQFYHWVPLLIWMPVTWQPLPECGSFW